MKPRIINSVHSNKCQSKSLFSSKMQNHDEHNSFCIPVLTFSRASYRALLCLSVNHWTYEEIIIRNCFKQRNTTRKKLQSEKAQESHSGMKIQVSATLWAYNAGVFKINNLTNTWNYVVLISFLLHPWTQLWTLIKGTHSLHINFFYYQESSWLIT